MRKQIPYTIKEKMSSVFMLVMLLWLTASLPFVYAAQQAEQKTAAPASQPDENSDNPLSNTTEEKTSSSGINTISEEYLHPADDTFHSFEILLSHQACHSVKEYVAFHGELLCPPPNA